MGVLISFSMAVLPAILLVIYFYRKDRIRPEPKGLILKVFFMGILSIFPAIAIEFALDGLSAQPLSAYLFLGPLFKSFIVAGLVEEYLKLVVVKRYAYRQVAFDEEMDGIVYAVMASLGFACLENVLYVLQENMTVAIIRAFTAVPMHAFTSGIMGFYIGKAKFSGSTGRERSLIAKGLFLAVIYHGIYDFLLFAMPDMNLLFGEAGNALGLGIIPLLLVQIAQLRRLMKSAIASDVASGRDDAMTVKS